MLSSLGPGCRRLRDGCCFWSQPYSLTNGQICISIKLSIFSLDLQGGVKTYAVQAGLERFRRTLKWASGLASLMLIAVLIAVVQVLPASWRVITLCFVGGVILGSAVYAVIAQRNSLGVTSLSRELSWLYLGLTYAVFRILPLILLMRLSLSDPRMAAATAFAILILLIESRFFLCYRYE